MNEPRPVTTLWSEEELNAALAELHNEQTVSTAALPAARAALLAAAAGEKVSDQHPPVGDVTPPSTAKARPLRSQPWVRGVCAAVIAAVLVAAALLVPSLVTSNGRPVVSADAARALTRAAAAIGASDAPVPAGQYRYLETHAWWSGRDSGPEGVKSAWLTEEVQTIWVPSDPADPTAMWMLKKARTGGVQWILGDRAAAEAAGLLDDSPYSTMDVQAACGDFYGAGGCERTGTWQDPTPAFLAALPRDPVALLDRLGDDSPDNGRGDAELLVTAAALLRTGLAPADLRSALYQALATLPGLDIVDATANLDGESGMALGIQDGATRQDIIIDPTTGAFIGEREVLVRDADGLPAGTLMSSTSLTTDVVDALGANP